MKVRSLLVAVFLVFSFAYCSPDLFAYMDDVKILEQAEIGKLTDAQLVDTYIDIVVELEAGRAFHSTSGFKPKEYTAYKDLLRYRIYLLMEFQKRGIEIPPTSP